MIFLIFFTFEWITSKFPFNILFISNNKISWVIRMTQIWREKIGFQTMVWPLFFVLEWRFNGISNFNYQLNIILNCNSELELETVKWNIELSPWTVITFVWINFKIKFSPLNLFRFNCRKSNIRFNHMLLTTRLIFDSKIEMDSVDVFEQSQWFLHFHV